MFCKTIMNHIIVDKFVNYFDNFQQAKNLHLPLESFMIILCFLSSPV